MKPNTQTVLALALVVKGVALMVGFDIDLDATEAWLMATFAGAGVVFGLLHRKKD